MREAVTVDVLRAQLGEAMHTALRKATSHYQAQRAHAGISALPNKEWASVLDFVISGLPKVQLPE